MKPTKFNVNKGITKLALELGINVATVSRKFKQGKTEQQVRDEAAAWTAKQAKQQKRTEEGQETYFEAQRRKEVALADLRELPSFSSRCRWLSV